MKLTRSNQRIVSILASRHNVSEEQVINAIIATAPTKTQLFHETCIHLYDEFDNITDITVSVLGIHYRVLSGCVSPHEVLDYLSANDLLSDRNIKIIKDVTNTYNEVM